MKKGRTGRDTYLITNNATPSYFCFSSMLSGRAEARALFNSEIAQARAF